MASQEDYDDYEEGHEAGEEAAEEAASWGGAVQSHIDVLMGRYGGKSKSWWNGFHDAIDGDWDPPEVEEDEPEE